VWVAPAVPRQLLGAGCLSALQRALRGAARLLRRLADVDPHPVVRRVVAADLLVADLLDVLGAGEVGERVARGRACVEQAAEIDAALLCQPGEVEFDSLLAVRECAGEGR